MVDDLRLRSSVESLREVSTGKGTGIRLSVSECNDEGLGDVSLRTTVMVGCRRGVVLLTSVSTTTIDHGCLLSLGGFLHNRKRTMIRNGKQMVQP